MWSFRSVSEITLGMLWPICIFATRHYCIHYYSFMVVLVFGNITKYLIFFSSALTLHGLCNLLVNFQSPL